MMASSKSQGQLGGSGQMAQLGHSPSPQTTPLSALWWRWTRAAVGLLGPNVCVGLSRVLACGINWVTLMCSECLGSQTRLQHSRRLLERRLPPLICVTLTIFPITD